jgi:hypothetical protein
MNSRSQVATSLAALLIFGVMQSAYAAEKKSVTFVNKFGTVLQRNLLPVPDRDGHEIGAQMRVDTSSSADADWDGATNTVIGQFDFVKGSGDVWGYSVRTFKNGDKVFFKYKANLKRSGEGNQWQTLGEGTEEIYGGTGKFANIKGTGTFAVQINPIGGIATNIVEVEY